MLATTSHQGYALLWFLVNDRIKLLAYRIFDPVKKDGAKLEAKAKSQPDATVEAKPEANDESKPVVKAEAKTDAKDETKPDAKVQTKPEATAEPKPNAKAESKAANNIGGTYQDVSGAPDPYTNPAASAPQRFSDYGNKKFSEQAWIQVASATNRKGQLARHFCSDARTRQPRQHRAAIPDVAAFT